MAKTLKKQWHKPELVPLELGQARHEIVAAINALKGNPARAREIQKLRSVVALIDAEIRG